MLANETDPVLDRFLPLARALARRVAAYGDQDAQDDLVQEGMIALCEALRTRPSPHKPHAFARCVLRRRMLTYHNRHSARRTTVPVEQAHPDGPVPDVLIQPAPDHDGRRALDHFLAELEKRHGRQARWAAENMIEPGDAFGRFLLLEIRDRERRAREAPGSARCFDLRRVPERYIREALGLNRATWRRLITDVREFAREWLARRGVRAPANPGDR